MSSWPMVPSKRHSLCCARVSQEVSLALLAALVASIGLIVNVELCEQLKRQHDSSSVVYLRLKRYGYSCNGVSNLMYLVLSGCAVPVLVGAVSLAFAAKGRKKQPIGSAQVAHDM